VILVDTSVWVDHLRKGDDRLAALLDRSRVVTHPFVIGELACGNLRNRKELLRLLQSLPRIEAVSQHEALFFIEQRKLMGKGIGFVDVHLLAAAAVEPEVRLWTRDKRLKQIASELNLAWLPD